MTILTVPKLPSSGAARFRWLASCAAALALLLMVGGDTLRYVAGYGIDVRDILWYVFLLGFAVVGGLITSRHPRNAIGWLFAGAALAVGGGWLATGFADYWIVTGVGPEWLGDTAAWYASVSWIPWVLVLSTFLLLLFPDGKLPSRRWRPIAWCSALGIGLMFFSESVRPGPFEKHPQIVNPYGVQSPLLDVVAGVSIVLLVAGTVGSAASLIIRFRRERGQARQQIKWVAAAALLLSVAVLGDASGPVILITCLVVAGAVSVSILKYRLYDIDVVINKTVVFVVLVGFITAVYAAIVVGLGHLLPVGDGNLGLAIVATALVAVVFEPVRVRVQHWANRLVYGRRASPYETLAAMSQSIGEAAGPEDALGEAARFLAEGTGAAQAVVWVARDGVLTPRATAGDDVSEPAPVTLVGGDLPVLAGTALVEPVRHEGKLVGAMSLAKRPGEGVNSTDRRLVEELAGQAALLLANTRLRSRLSDRLVELRTSRQRMITAQDRARHALERDLHDGAQQELVALKVKLGLARTIATREGDTLTAEQLEATVAIADRAVDTLRDVARGIYPPLLESDGLAAALSAQARRADLAVTVLDRIGTRYPRELESTAYFCSLEALRNAVRHANADHAHVELDGTGTDLVVTITDDGEGFDPDHTSHGDGLAHMADRVDAIGGTLSVTSRPGHGTSIILTLPTPPDAVADDPLSAPQLAGVTQ
jgi:signal transduction histidine kinase